MFEKSKAGLAAACMSAIALGACSPTIKDAVYNEPVATSIEGEFPGTATDAKIRMVWTPKVETLVKDEAGNVRWEKRRRLCAEPSPDAFSQIAASFGLDLSANVAGKGSGSLSTQSTLTELAKRLGTRTVAIQLLRDGLYRLCEADINGRIGDFNYHIVQANMDQVMLRLVAIENISRSALVPADSAAGAALQSFEQAKLERAQRQATLDGASGTLIGLDNRLRDAERRNANARAVKAGAEAEIGQIDKDIAEKKADIGKLDRAKPADKAQIDKLENDIAVLEARKIAATRDVAAANQLVTTSGAEISAITGDRTKAKNALDTAAQELLAADKNLAPLEAAASGASRKLAPAAVAAIRDILYPQNSDPRTVIAACLTWLAKQEEDGIVLDDDNLNKGKGRVSLVAKYCGKFLDNAAASSSVPASPSVRAESDTAG